MNMVNNNGVKTKSLKQKEKFLRGLKKVLLYTLGGIGAIILLAVLYKILEFLFVAFVLLVGCVGTVRWKWW